MLLDRLYIFGYCILVSGDCFLRRRGLLLNGFGNGSRGSIRGHLINRTSARRLYVTCFTVIAHLIARLAEYLLYLENSSLGYVRKLLIIVKRGIGIKIFHGIAYPKSR